MVVTTNRPQRMSAMTLSMFFLLEQAWKEASADDDVRAIVLTGADGNFSSGMDLRSLVGDADEPDAVDTSKAMEEDPDFIYRGLLKTYQPTKPVIAAVEGNAIAGGTEILQGTDIRVAAESAEVRRLRGPLVAVPNGGSASGCAARSPTPTPPTSSSPASTSRPKRPPTSGSSAMSSPTARPSTRRSRSQASWPERPPGRRGHHSDPSGDRVNAREGRLRARVVVRARGDVLRGRPRRPQAFKEKRRLPAKIATAPAHEPLTDALLDGASTRPTPSPATSASGEAPGLERREGFGRSPPTTR